MVFWCTSVFGSRWVTTIIDISNKHNWSKNYTNKLFLPNLSWFDLAVTLRWPCHDLGVAPHKAQPQPLPPCVLGLGFINFVGSGGHWSKNDILPVIWSISAILERGDIRLVFDGVLPLQPLYYPHNLLGFFGVPQCSGLGRLQPS